MYFYFIQIIINKISKIVTIGPKDNENSDSFTDIMLNHKYFKIFFDFGLTSDLQLN